MSETTTIQVRKDQAKQLQEIARENGNYKTVIDRLLEDYNDTTSEDMDGLRGAIETVEERTGRIEQQLEQLGGR